MKILVAVLIFFSVSYSQNWDLIPTTIFSISSGLSEGYRLQDAKKNDLAWHQWKYVSHCSGVVLGVTIGLDSDNNYLKMGAKLLNDSAIFWILHDMAINSVLNRDLFYMKEGRWYDKDITFRLAFLLLTSFIRVIL